MKPLHDGIYDEYLSITYPVLIKELTKVGGTPKPMSVRLTGKFEIFAKFNTGITLLKYSFDNMKF